MVDRQPVISDTDRAILAGVVAWLRGEPKPANAPEVKRGEAALAIETLLTVVTECKHPKARCVYESDDGVMENEVFTLREWEWNVKVRRKALGEAAAYLERDDFYNSSGMAAETVLRRMANAELAGRASGPG